jgi:hypothetical protein
VPGEARAIDLPDTARAVVLLVDGLGASSFGGTPTRRRSCPRSPPGR